MLNRNLMGGKRRQTEKLESIMAYRSFFNILLIAFFSIIIFTGITFSADPKKEELPGTITNALGMEFVLISPGTFIMGSPSKEPGRYGDEGRHQVTLTRAYYLQTTEVTQGQWNAVMGSNPSYFKNCGDDCPVEQVSWNDVQEFIRRLNGQQGADIYRLPTEAEWEYAANAGSLEALANGALGQTGCEWDRNLSAMGWYCGNAHVSYNGCYDLSGRGGPKCAGPKPVAQKKPNAWGLYDMHGNVWEWCADWYGDYPTSAVTDPTGPSSGDTRVLRGGSWINYARFCRSASRFDSVPSLRYANSGFRLALSADME
jgi:formylglycine-generating enzyme required for sulfatase activity